MIKATDAIRVARALIGTPYAELDCINLIKKVIRTAPGGVSSYTTAGTNSLWKSAEATAKYRDLTWRQEGIAGARAGMLALKRSGEDVHHAGLVTEDGTVVHSSSAYGGRGVVETPLTAAEGWNLLAVHRYIEPAKSGETEDDVTYLYDAKVTLKNPESYLNVRNAPEGDEIGRLTHGAPVQVYTETGDWAFIHYGDSGVGYVSKAFLEQVEDAEEDEKTVEIDGVETAYTTLMDTEGTTIRLAGSWRVAED